MNRILKIFVVFLTLLVPHVAEHEHHEDCGIESLDVHCGVCLHADDLPFSFSHERPSYEQAKQHPASASGRHQYVHIKAASVATIAFRRSSYGHPSPVLSKVIMIL